MFKKQKLSLLAFASLFLIQFNSYAVGTLRLESSGFLRTAEERPNSVTNIGLGPYYKSENNYVQFTADLLGIVQVQDRSSFTIEANELYMATSPQLMEQSQFSVGRRKYNWSEQESYWKMGFFAPRFLWDPLDPENIGMTGAFFTHRTDHWSFGAYASPLSIPERGFPVRNENGRLVSSNTLYIEPYREAVVSNQSIPIRYNIEYPEKISSLLLNPNGLIQIKFEENTNPNETKGIWFQSLYGLLPMYQANLAIEGGLNLAENFIDITIHPDILLHHVFNIEAGVTEKSFSLWGSATADRPLTKEIPNSWATATNTPAFMASLGGGVSFTNQLNLRSSIVYVKEDPAVVRSEAAFTLSLPSRFNYKKAVKTGLEYQANYRLKYQGNWIYDVENRSNLVSFDIDYALSRMDQPIRLNVGLDLIESSTGKGFFGQYVGNDRFRGGVTYAF